MNTLLQDTRYALRQLRKSPAFTITVIVTLALGLGANAAVFTLFDQVLLRMLPVERPKELVRFVWTGTFSGSASSFGGDSTNYFSYPMYKDLRDRNKVFQGVLAADRISVGVSWHNQAEKQAGGDCYRQLLSGAGTEACCRTPVHAAGRHGQEFEPGGGSELRVLEDTLWRVARCGGAGRADQRACVHHPRSGSGELHSAIGGYRPGVFIPISMVEIAMPWMAPRDDLNNHQSIWLTLVARLKSGVSPAQAEAGLGPLWHSLRAYELTLYKSKSERFKKKFLDDSRLQVKDDSTGFSPGRSDLKTPLVILMGMAGLLVAMCAINVATLLLLRAAGRAREMSMRYALGAKRSRIISQLLVEGGLLGLAGAAAGLGVAPLVAKTLVRIMTNADPGSEPYSSAIDVRVLLFTVALSIVASLLFSFAPVLHFLRPDLANALRQNAGTATRGLAAVPQGCRGSSNRTERVAAGRRGTFCSYAGQSSPTVCGFDTGNLATFTLDPTIAGYGEDRTPQTVANALEALRRIPGVASASGTTDPELAGDTNSSTFTIQGYKPAEDERMNFEQPYVTPGYFATLRQPLLAGREFSTSDAKGAPKVAVVNLSLAKQFYGSAQNALGRAVGLGGGDGVKPDTTIVGVVGDIKHADLRTDIGPAIYEPYAQIDHPVGVQVYLRTVAPTETVENAIRQTMHQFDPAIVVDGLRTMELQVDSSASQERALAFLAMGFALLSMVLAAVGLYGVLAYSTEQRTREIGVRLALGAQRSGVVMLVVREMALIAGDCDDYRLALRRCPGAPVPQPVVWRDDI